MDASDQALMRRALALAERGAGRVSPNPLVGAVLAGPDGEVIGEGYHAEWGGPHAEVEAVRAAETSGRGSEIAGATLYVTLEPCAHHGKTPPCAGLVLEKGIARVVAAMEDPDPRVSGAGFAALREAGVDVRVGIGEREARRLNEAYLRHKATGLPLVTLKLALSLDGRVATRTGDSRWVTSAEARALVHRWRAESDAVLVGAGTARADDPRLTVRGAAAEAGAHQPLRVVLDRAGTLPGVLRLFGVSDAARTVAFVSPGSAPPYAEALAAAGGAIVEVEDRAGHLDLREVLRVLGAGAGLPGGARPVQSVLVEAGPGLATALLRGGSRRPAAGVRRAPSGGRRRDAGRRRPRDRLHGGLPGARRVGVGDRGAGRAAARLHASRRGRLACGPRAAAVFTGIVEEVGTVAGAEDLGGGRRLTLACSFAAELAVDESVAVDGACLTVVALGAGTFDAVAVEETLSRTTLGTRRPADRVNLERAVPLGGRLDGHLVQGHVDGAGEIVSVDVLDDSRVIRIAYPRADAPLLVPKGSVAVDGVSLTVARLDEPAGTFEVAVIPHTLAGTTAGLWAAGRRVNLEYDLIGKYVLRARGLEGDNVTGRPDGAPDD